METVVLPFIGKVNHMVPFVIIVVAWFCMLANSTIANWLGKIASMKFAVVAPILMIIASLLWNDWIFSFFWGFALIYTLERLRKEKEKEKV